MARWPVSGEAATPKDLTEPMSGPLWKGNMPSTSPLSVAARHRQDLREALEHATEDLRSRLPPEPLSHARELLTVGKNMTTASETEKTVGTAKSFSWFDVDTRALAVLIFRRAFCRVKAPQQWAVTDDGSYSDKALELVLSLEGQLRRVLTSEELFSHGGAPRRSFISDVESSFKGLSPLNQDLLSPAIFDALAAEALPAESFHNVIRRSPCLPPCVATEEPVSALLDRSMDTIYPVKLHLDAITESIMASLALEPQGEKAAGFDGCVATIKDVVRQVLTTSFEPSPKPSSTMAYDFAENARALITGRLPLQGQEAIEFGKLIKQALQDASYPVFIAYKQITMISGVAIDHRLKMQDKQEEPPKEEVRVLAGFNLEAMKLPMNVALTHGMRLVDGKQVAVRFSIQECVADLIAQFPPCKHFLVADGELRKLVRQALWQLRHELLNVSKGTPYERLESAIAHAISIATNPDIVAVRVHPNVDPTKASITDLMHLIDNRLKPTAQHFVQLVTHGYNVYFSTPEEEAEGEKQRKLEAEFLRQEGEQKRREHSRQCRTCNGTGEGMVPDIICESCEGTGHINGGEQEDQEKSAAWVAGFENDPTKATPLDLRSEHPLMVRHRSALQDVSFDKETRIGDKFTQEGFVAEVTPTKVRIATTALLANVVPKLTRLVLADITPMPREKVSESFKECLGWLLFQTVVGTLSLMVLNPGKYGSNMVEIAWRSAVNDPTGPTLPFDPAYVKTGLYPQLAVSAEFGSWLERLAGKIGSGEVELVEIEKLGLSLPADIRFDHAWSQPDIVRAIAEEIAEEMTSMPVNKDQENLDRALGLDQNGETNADGGKTAGKVQRVATEVQSNAIEAAWRTAGSQLVKLARDPLVAVLQRHLGPDDPALRVKIGAFLETEAGTALLAALLSVGLMAVPVNGMGDVPARLSKELRIKAMADIGDLIAEILTGPLRQVISFYLQDMDGAMLAATSSLPQAAPRELPAATGPIGVSEARHGSSVGKGE